MRLIRSLRILKNTQANLTAAEGQLADTQGVLWNNPQIFAERVRREVPDPGFADRTQREWGVGLTQTLEISTVCGAVPVLEPDDARCFTAVQI